MSYLDISVYIIVTVVIFILIYAEYKDLNCPDGLLSKDSACGCYNGLYLNGTQATSQDDTSVIMNKTGEASDGFSKLIVWRRAAILSFFISIILVFCIRNKKHELICSDFLLTFICIFTFLYFFTAFYEYHVYKKIPHVIKSNMKILAEKIEPK